jgi:hypothetical protein
MRQRLVLGDSVAVYATMIWRGSGNAQARDAVHLNGLDR